MNSHFVCLKPQDVQIYVRTEADPLPLQSHVTLSGSGFSRKSSRKKMNAGRGKGQGLSQANPKLLEVSPRDTRTHAEALQGPEMDTDAFPSAPIPSIFLFPKRTNQQQQKKGAVASNGPKL